MCTQIVEFPSTGQLCDARQAIWRIKGDLVSAYSTLLCLFSSHQFLNKFINPALIVDLRLQLCSPISVDKLVNMIFEDTWILSLPLNWLQKALILFIEIILHFRQWFEQIAIHILTVLYSLNSLFRCESQFHEWWGISRLKDLQTKIQHLSHFLLVFIQVDEDWLPLPLNLVGFFVHSVKALSIQVNLWYYVEHKT